jgi:tripartite ATP-independent transporter DctM subunit
MVPEMQKRGYKKHMAIGPILGTGGLAMLIPPSALAVLLATLSNLDVGKLLIAGLMPGLILACMYALMILAMCLWDPEAAPSYEVEDASFGEKMRLLFTDILPMMSIVLGVIILIMQGWATPSESAAFGCLGVLVLAVIYRKLTWDSFVNSVTGALKVTTLALLIIFGSATFSNLLAFSGASSGLIGWATSFEVDPLYMLLIMFCILLVLGMFMDQLSMMLLTVPIFFPLAETYGFDLIWFAVIVLLALEISFTTPPFGLLLFVMKGVAPPGTTMRDIYLAAMPYIGCSMLLVALLIAFPQIALWLPYLGQ